MLVPLSWLKKHLDLTPQQQSTLTPEKIAEVLTLAGLEVDKVEATQLGFEGVVVAKVLEATQHPEAERLRVAKVTDGTSTFQIVCGAPNCREGLVTALAKIGATLKTESGETFKIKKSKLRGIESEGMLCSEGELGLSQEGEGIIELNGEHKLGTKLEELYGDTVFEISLTPNLGHCLSIKGIARELSSLLNLKLASHPSDVLESDKISTKDKISVSIENPEHCYTYSCRYIENVEVGPSPKWLVDRLTACGLRSINNIVDVTNYIMMEYGQPLHAFDFDKIEGKTLFIKAALEPISIETLDEISRTIPTGTLLITDESKPLALAGIMGGKSSSITSETKNIILESAHFDPSLIRRSMKALNLRSDSSSRFEKGIDALGVIKALNRAAALIADVSNGIVAKDPIIEMARPYSAKKITCRLSKINSVLGTHLSISEVETIFHRLRMEVTTEGEKGVFHLTIPSYRNDIKEEIDLVEEVARIYGYNNIAFPETVCKPSDLDHSPLYLMEKTLRSCLISQGLQEMLTCDLISPKLASLSLENPSFESALIHVMQPSSIDQSILRPSMATGLLQAVKHNFDHQNFSISAFEIGLIHYKLSETFVETPSIGIVLTGDKKPLFWGEKTQKVDIFDLKGLIENLLDGVFINNTEYQPSFIKGLHPGRQGMIKGEHGILGFFGELHPSVTKALDLDSKVYFAQLDILELMKHQPKARLLKPLPIYPGTERDWTATFKKETTMHQILSTLRSLSSRLLKETFLLDIYTSEKLGNDKKNVTLRFIYRDDQKTLSLEAVEKEHARLLAQAKQKLQDSLCE